MRLLSLRDADARRRIPTERIALQNQDLPEGIRQCTRGGEAGNSGADDDRLLTDESRQDDSRWLPESV
jgi:hypothetical protein